MAPDDAAVVTWGRRAWTAIGGILLAVGLVYVASQVSLVLTPFVLALFPAALLDPVAARLRATRIPDAVVALLILLVLFAVVVAAGAFIGAALVDQVPQIVDAVVAGLDRLETSVDWSVLPGDVGGLRDLVTGAGAALTSGAAPWPPSRSERSVPSSARSSSSRSSTPSSSGSACCSCGCPSCCR